jgi:hypothetical protein
MARPMPDEEPVTTATLLARRPGCDMLRGLDSKRVLFFLELNLVSLIEERMGWTEWRDSNVGNETEGKKKRG